VLYNADFSLVGTWMILVCLYVEQYVSGLVSFAWAWLTVWPTNQPVHMV